MSEENGNEVVTFTQEQMNEAIASANTAKDDEYKGILSKNNELLGEKKAAKLLAQEAETARLLAVEETARKGGNLEELETTLNAKHQGVVDGLNAKLKEKDSTILGGKKDKYIAELSGEFLSAGGGKLMISSLVESNYGEDGKVVTQFKGLDGSVVTTDVNEFKKYMRDNPEITPYLKAVDSSGGGSQGNKSSASGNDGTTQSKLSARLKKQGLI